MDLAFDGLAVQGPNKCSSPVASGFATDLERALERLLRRVRMTVVHAGDKESDGAVIHRTHNTRSWKSYEAVARDIAAALERIGCRDVAVMAEDMRLGQRLAQHRSHLAWLNTGGVQGRTCVAHAPSLLELAGIPFIGHEPLTAAILDTKPVFKYHLKALGLPTAPFVTVHPRDLPFRPAFDENFKSCFAGYRGSYVVKPANGRASQHVHVVDDLPRLRDVVAEVAAATGNIVMIERYLPGREFCIAVCGNVVAKGGRLSRRTEPFVFAALERNLGPQERIFTSMDTRPISGERARLLDPVADADILTALGTLARRVFRAFDLDTLVRIDIRADEQGRLFVLEANPKPDLKAPEAGTTSLVAIGLESEGMTYDDLILSLFANRIDLALRDPAVRHEALLRLI